MSDETLSALDDAVRAHAAGDVTDGEAVVAWMVVAGTRSVDGGGATVVLTDESLPRWQGKGMLVDALDLTRRLDQDDTP